mgnify:CR=1 FL=1
MKILVIDDNDAIRTILRNMLVSEGYDVVVAADGGWMPQSAEHLAAIDHGLHFKGPGETLLFQPFCQHLDNAGLLVWITHRFLPLLTAIHSPFAHVTWASVHYLPPSRGGSVKIVHR